MMMQSIASDDNSVYVGDDHLKSFFSGGPQEQLYGIVHAHQWMLAQETVKISLWAKGISKS